MEGSSSVRSYAARLREAPLVCNFGLVSPKIRLTIFTECSPDSLDLLASADSIVFRNESDTLGQSCSADEPIARIARIVWWKLIGQHGNLYREWTDCSPRANLLDKVFHRSVNFQAVVSGQPCQLP